MRTPPLLVGVLLGLGLLEGPLPAGQAQTRETLEVLLERARNARAARQATLRVAVSEALGSFAQLSVPVSRQRRAELVDALAALGPEVGPLLVPFIDPEPEGAPTAEPEEEEPEAGKEPDPDLALARVRARQVAEALARVHSMAVTDGVLEVLRAGSAEGKSNALRVLETSPEPTRTRPHLVQAYRSGTGRLKQDALRALIRVGGPENRELLAEVLASEEDALVALALEALTETRETAAATDVRAVLAAPARAARHADRLLDYYRSQPELVDSEILDLFVDVARQATSSAARLSVLAQLPDLNSGSTGDLRRALEPLTKTSDRAVREAALVALVRLGDRGARRTLLRTFDKFVDENDRFPDAYVRRGDIYLRIEDWDDAIRDFQQAIKLSRDDPRPQPDAYVGLARAYARRGRLKDAAEWVRKAPISMRDLRALADDPDFHELRDSKYGKEAFGL